MWTSVLRMVVAMFDSAVRTQPKGVIKQFADLFK